MIPTRPLVAGCRGRQADSNPNQPSEEHFFKRGWKILTAPLDPLAYMEAYSWEHINILIS